MNNTRTKASHGVFQLLHHRFHLLNVPSAAGGSCCKMLCVLLWHRVLHACASHGLHVAHVYHKTCIKCVHTIRQHHCSALDPQVDVLWWPCASVVCGATTPLLGVDAPVYLQQGAHVKRAPLSHVNGMRVAVGCTCN